MFSFFFVAGTAEWTSQKEGEKIAADANRSKKKLAEIEAIRRSSSDADLLLKNNTHILGIINETLTRRKSADVRILHKIEGQTKVLEQDAKVRSEKKAALSSATDKASRASAAAKQARHALEEANRTFARKLADKRSVEAALSKAKEHLEDVVQNIGSSDVIAADMDVKDKAAEFKAAAEQLVHAEGTKTAKATALSEALAKVRGLEAAQQKAKEAFADADAEFKSASEALEKMREQAAPILLGLQKLNRSLGKQASVVESMRSHSASLHEREKATQKEYGEIEKMLKDDDDCKNGLQEAEGLEHDAIISYNLTIAAWRAAPDDSNLFDAAWESKDKLQNATYHKYLKQKACAPEDVDVPPKPPLTTCEKNTGGTCQFLWCDVTRGAQCDQDTHACVCTGATCAVDGGCHSRGPPATILAKPTALGQATTQATTKVSPLAGSLELLVFAAVLVTVTVAVVRKRRASRRVELPQFSLG